MIADATWKALQPFLQSITRADVEMVHHDINEIQSPDTSAQRENRKILVILGAGAAFALLLLMGGLFLW